MINILHLYRGDSIYNSQTKPDGFRSEGIRSAAFGGGGYPRNIENIGEIETIKTHIDHLTKVEKDYYKITDFISFTEEEATAQKWAAELNPDELLPAPAPYQETRYVFHLSIPINELQQLDKGVWQFRYQCTPQKRQAFSADDRITTIMLQFAGCGVCEGLHKMHSVILIKPAIALEHLASESKYQRALKLAVKTDEWLILPNDRMEQGQFRQTRIYLADFWKADLYIKKGEPIRTPESFKLT